MDGVDLTKLQEMVSGLVGTHSCWETQYGYTIINDKQGMTVDTYAASNSQHGVLNTSNIVYTLLNKVPLADLQGVPPTHQYLQWHYCAHKQRS